MRQLYSIRELSEVALSGRIASAIQDALADNKVEVSNEVVGKVTDSVMEVLEKFMIEFNVPEQKVQDNFEITKDEKGNAWLSGKKKGTDSDVEGEVEKNSLASDSLIGRAKARISRSFRSK
jgi:hypothetical protein